MHQNHDLELIAAFAEGRLDDTAAAEALVADCEECAEIFRSHRTVLQAVHLQAPVAMSELERHRLHASVWDSLQTGASSSAATPAKKAARTPWWYRVVPVAAALVVVVGIGANLLPGGDSASGDLETVADTAGGPADAYRSLGADEAQGGAETTAAADAPDTDATASPAGESQLAAPATELEDAAADFQQRAVADAAEVADKARACVDADPAAEGTPVASESSVVDDSAVWLVGLGTSAEITSVNIYAEADCEVLHRGKDDSTE